MTDLLVLLFFIHSHDYDKIHHNDIWPCSEIYGISTLVPNLVTDYVYIRTHILPANFCINQLIQYETQILIQYSKYVV